MIATAGSDGRVRLWANIDPQRRLIELEDENRKIRTKLVEQYDEITQLRAQVRDLKSNSRLAPHPSLPVEAS